MKWLEIIKVSSSVDGREAVKKEIADLLTRSKIEGLHDIRVFQNTATGDREIHFTGGNPHALHKNAEPKDRHGRS